MKYILQLNFKFTIQLLLLSLVFLISACDNNKNVFNNGIQNNAKATSPTQVSISDFDKQVNLSWKPVKGAKFYKIFISEKPNIDISKRQAEIETNLENVSISEETFPGFKQNTKYFITIITISENDEEFSSNEFVIISKTEEVVETLAPPENFTVTAEEGQINLDWTINDSAINYVIYWSTTDASVNPINANHITEIAAPPFKHKNLSSDSTYHYRVGAITTKGASPLTTPLTASPEKISFIPATPTGLTAVASDGIVALRWNSVINADSYTLYMAEESGVNKSNVSQLQGGETYTEIKGISTNRIKLANGTNYYFSLSAENHIGSSETTAQVAATPKSFRPQVPNNTSASAGARSISLQWDEVPDATSYSVYWSTESGVDVTSTNAFHELTKPALVHKNIEQTITHYYVITSHNTEIESETSAEIAATPFIPQPTPPAPSNILSEVNASSVTFKWDEVPEVDEYILYIATDESLTKVNYALLPGGTRHRNLQQTSFVRKELTPNTTYFYAISTVKNNIESELSPLQSLITLDVSDKPNEGEGISDPINIIAPESLNKAIINTHQLQAFSGEDNVTSQVTWRVNDTNIASISNDIESKGLLTILSSGNVSVTAQINDLEITHDILILDLLPPIDLTAIANEENIELTWQGQGMFNIYRSTELPVSLESEPLTTTTEFNFTDNDTATGTTYYYALTTTESINDRLYHSEISETVSATIVFIENPVDTTAPTIFNFTPEQDAEAVPINASISITFSEDMDSNTLLPQNMTFLSQDHLVEFNVAFTGTQLTILPLEPLNYGSNYIFSVNNSVTDLAGNALAQPLVMSINTEIAPTLSITAPTAINKANQANQPLSLYVNGVDKTTEATWRSSNNSIATINNDPESNGLLTPVSKGDVQITASFAGIDTNVNIYVYDLNIPINVQAKRINGTVELSWESIGTFEVYRSESLPVNVNSQSLISTTTNTFIDDTPLNTASYYAVRAMDIKGELIYHSELSEAAMVGQADIISPEIRSTTPTDNTKLVPINSTISITFSEAMNPETINQQNLTLSHQENAVEFDTTFTGDKLIISPKNKLSYEANYIFTLNNKVTDLAGNPLSTSLNLSFTTELTPELIINAPKAINKVEFSSFPLTLNSNGIDVSANAQWRSNNDSIATVSNEAINKGELTLLSKGNVTITASYEEIATNVDIYVYDLNTPTNVQAKRINGAVELSWEGAGTFEVYRSENLPVSINNQSLTSTTDNAFIDDAPLIAASYYAILSTDMNDDLKYRSKLSEPAMVELADIIPPEILTSTPINNANLIPVESSISIAFSETMNVETINQENLTLSHQESSVEFDISFTNDTLVIKPKNKLLYETSYVFTFNNKVTDLAGNPLTAPQSISFTTELAPVLSINAPRSINKNDFTSYPLTLSSDGINVNPTAQWRSSNGTIASVSNEINTKGQLTLLSKGNVTITALYEGIDTSVDIYVYDLATPTNALAKRFNGTVELSWEGNGLFEIYRSETLPVTRESFLVSTLEETTFIDQTPLATSSYYAILSSEINGETIYRGNLSEPAKVDTKPKVLPPPENIQANPKNNQILLTWDAVIEAADYIVRWAPIPGDVERSGEILNHESPLSASHIDLANGDIIYYTIATINSEGIIGSASEEIKSEVGQQLTDLTFSDPALTRCVAGKSEQYVHNLLTLNCADTASITDLRGIEQLSELNSFSASLSASASLNPLAALAEKLTTLNFRNGALHSDLSVFSELNNLTWLLTSNILIDEKQLDAISKNTSLQYLFLENSGITDITPIMDMASLLSISMNDSSNSESVKLSTLPLAKAWSKLINLTSFSIGYNNVSDISGITASGLPKLESLSIGRQGYPKTVLINLPSSEEWNLPALTSIEFIGNGITDINPISKLVNLDRLNLSTNAIDRGVYALKNLTSAIDIDLSNNPNMYCSEVEALNALSTANISWDECQTNMPIDVLTDQNNQIIADFNLIECIYFNDVANVEDVSSIDCFGGEGGGSISNLEGVEIFRNLERLFLDFSSVEDVSNLKYIQNLKELSVLANDNLNLLSLTEVNQLEKLRLQQMFLDDVEFLSSLKNLVELNLRHNNISDFSPLKNLPNLITLSIGYNEINNKTLTSLIGLETLQNLYLDNNLFTDISPLSKLTSLTLLDLSVNDVSDITPLASLKEINYLYLNSNNIKNLPSLKNFSGWEKLIELDLSRNELFTRSTVDTNVLDILQKLKNLKTLDISHNHLEWFGGLDRLSSLESLYLNNNNLRDISTIGTGSENNPNLKIIDLSNNFIHDPSPLEGFTRLGSLNLMNNILYNKIVNLATLRSTKINANDNPHMSCNEVKKIEASFNDAGSFDWTTCYDQDGSGLSPQLRDILSDPLIVDTTLRSCIRSLMSQEPFGASQIHEVQEFYCNTEGNVQDLSGLRRLAALRTIDLPFHSVNDISELQNLHGLVDIDLSSNRVTTGASNLQGLSHLNTVILSDNNNLSCKDINSLDSIDGNDGNAKGKVIWTYCDSPIVDQDNWFDIETAVWCPSGGSYFQSFKPVFNKLAGIDLNIRTVNWQSLSDFDSIVRIRESVGGTPGNILATGKWSVFDEILFSGDLVSHVFNPVLTVTPNQEYFIEWISPSPIPVPETTRLQSLSLGMTNTNSYKLGSSFSGCAGGFSPTEREMIFRTRSIFDLGPTF